MKKPQNRIGLSLGTLVLGGWMAGSVMSTAQETPPRPGHPPGPPPPSHVDGAPKDAPQAQRMRMAMQRVAELHRAGKHDEANQLATRLRNAVGERPGMDRGRNDRQAKDRQPKDRPEVRKHDKADRPVAPIAEARMKMQRLKQAAQLLQEAGYPDQAAKARQEIERIEVEARREAEKAKAKMEAEKEKARHEAEKAKAKMEAEKEKARHEPAEKKTDDGMREEMKKLRRENEELRQQMRRMQAERGSKPPGDMPRPQERRPE